MGAKAINEMTDAEIDALTPDELIALTATIDGGDASDDDDDDDGNNGADDGADEGAGGDAGNDEGDDDDGAGADDDAPGELTAEQLARLAEDDEPDAGDPGEMVPRSRLNEALKSGNDYKLMVRALMHAQGVAPAAPAAPVADKVETPVAPTYDFKAANREYHRLVTEGEDEAAAAKLDEIEDKRQEITEFKLSQIREETREESRQQLAQRDAIAEVNAVTASIYKEYPFLDNKGKAPDEAAILAVNAKAKQLIAKGKSPAEALLEAGDSIGKRFAKLLGLKPDKAPSKSDKTLADGQDPRSKDAMRRNIALRQPPVQKAGVGNREQSRTLSIKDMTDEQIDKLSPTELAELKGDNRIG